MMQLILAAGGKGDLAGSSLVLILELVLVLGVDALLVAAPIVLARRRLLAGAESIAAVAILWGILAAGFAGSAVVAEFRWARERLTLLMSGYDVPAAGAEGPQHPWAWWIVIVGIYAVLALVAVWGKPQGPRNPGERPQGP